jgi:hypothetical protein
VVVELSVMVQRYQSVVAVVQGGWKVTEVAQRLEVARQSATTGSPATLRTPRIRNCCRVWRSLT